MTLVPFPPHTPGFLLNCPDGRELAIKRTVLADGQPALELCVGNSQIGYAEVGIPLDELEVVIEGMRSTARRPGGPALASVHVQLADPGAFTAMIRNTVRRGPEGNGA